MRVSYKTINKQGPSLKEKSPVTAGHGDGIREELLQEVQLEEGEMYVGA